MATKEDYEILKERIQGWLERNLEVWTKAGSKEKFIQGSHVSTQEIAEGLAKFLADDRK